ncbi:hypothetical protein [Bradyrhizobium sp. CCBAU 11361]|uniref:hypothetical protein n=1 Tax=Bradyrhizobium sp. CCBAU 11361 TaxID=1630812 RepID=UPI002303B90D|nr:hypothetical protein [Bradyrhizobium sp. CCBAU 11361]
MVGKSEAVYELLDHPGRCIHIGDRESDIYELFCAAPEIGTHFLIRTCVESLAGMGITRLPTKWTRRAPPHRSRDSNGDPDQDVLDITYRKIRILPPMGKQKRYIAKLEWYGLSEDRGIPQDPQIGLQS